jgi:rubredoxin
MGTRDWEKVSALLGDLSWDYYREGIFLAKLMNFTNLPLRETIRTQLLIRNTGEHKIKVSTNVLLDGAYRVIKIKNFKLNPGEVGWQIFKFSPKKKTGKHMINYCIGERKKVTLTPGLGLMLKPGYMVYNLPFRVVDSLDCPECDGKAEFLPMDKRHHAWRCQKCGWELRSALLDIPKK